MKKRKTNENKLSYVFIKKIFIQNVLKKLFNNIKIESKPKIIKY